jgi:uncharacterized protein YodC (DUF2158 family)
MSKVNLGDVVYLPSQPNTLMTVTSVPNTVPTVQCSWLDRIDHLQKAEFRVECLVFFKRASS